MTSSISKTPSGGVYAFLGHEPLPTCAMVHGRPVVDAVLDVKELQNWVTTLEEILPSVAPCHYGTLSLMIVRLQVVLDQHDKEHQQVVTEAPTAEDLIEYLASYIKAMGPREVVS